MRRLLQPSWKLAAAATTMYWLVLFTATHTPTLPISGEYYNDKLVHFSAFACLGILLAATYWLRLRERAAAASIGRYLWLLVLIAVYAAIDELLQIPIRGRDGSLGDWAADVLGAAVGMVVLGTVIRLTAHYRAPPPAEVSPTPPPNERSQD